MKWIFRSARSACASAAVRVLTTGCARSSRPLVRTFPVCGSAWRRSIRPLRFRISWSTSSHPSPSTSERPPTRRSRAPRRRSRSHSARACRARWSGSMADVGGGFAPSITPTLSSARLGGSVPLAQRSERSRGPAPRLGDRESVSVTDATAGARAFAWSALVANSGRTIALVAPSEDRARRWRAELAGWLGDERVLAFPERETMPFEVSAPSGTAVHQRPLTLWRRAPAQPPVAVVPSLRALLEHTIPPDELARRGRTLRAGDRLSWNETAAWLFDLGYEPVTEVSEPGTFSRRGGIIDIYPASADQPARVELFGDEIETLRAFDPVTQRSQSPIDELVVLPAREFSMERAPELAERLASAGWDHAARPDDDEAADLSAYAHLVDSLREGAYAPGADAFAPALGATASLLDHLGDRATVVFEDTVELELAHGALEAQAEEKRGQLADEGLAVSVFPPPYVTRSRVDDLAQRHGAIRVRPAPGAMRLGWSGLTSYAGRLDQFLREVAGSGRDTRIVATPQAARLAELLADRQIPAVAQETVEEPPAAGSLVVARVPLPEGFAVPELDLRVFTDAKVFGFRKPRHPEQRRRRVHIGSFLADLKPGDHVVDEYHGIERFDPFVTAEAAGVEREDLELRFPGTDCVRLPPERVDKVTRYVGGTPPGLSTLGRRDWLPTKARGKKAAADIARELLRRSASPEESAAVPFGPG